MSVKEKLLKMLKSALIATAAAALAGLANWILGQEWGAMAIVATAVSSWLAATAKTWMGL